MEEKRQQCCLGINIKSLVIGFLLALCIILGSGSSKDGGNGQYQCSASEQYVYVLDTQTVHTWRVGKADTIDFGTPENRISIA